MPGIFDRLDRKKAKDLRVLSDFIAVYCRENHQSAEKTAFVTKDERLQHVLGDKKPVLCPDCTRLFHHGTAKLLLCPYDPKPMCKKCPTHCYAPGYREQMRQVMRFSGRYMIRHGRLDLLVHYLF